MKKMLMLVLALVLCFCMAAAQGEKLYRTCLTSDYPTLNVHNCVEASLETLASYSGAALYRMVPSEDGKGFVWMGDIAASEPVEVAENVWQIALRPEACWANGEAINADTFIYTYKMMLNPLMVNSMSNFVADNSIKILNATEYAAQGTDNTVAWEDVGIKKIDDYTLEITVAATKTATDVMNHFSSRASIPVYPAYYEAGMNADGTSTTYGTTLDTYMSCGPYVLDTWTFDSIQIYKKNANYWLPELYNYDTVEIRVVPGTNARVELWEQGLLDDYTPDANTIETYIDDPRLVEYGSNTVHHIDVSSQNESNPLSKSINYRKALYHAMDREALADLFGYKMPTGTYASLQTGILSESHLTYRESEYGQAVAAMVETWGPYGYNPELAREYLAKAYEECGVDADTVITLKFGVDSDDDPWPTACQYLQQSLEEVFEGKIKIDLVSYNGISTTQWKNSTPDWDLSHNEWARSAARTEPYQIFYYYTSAYSSHPNNFLDDEFDAQYEVCKSLAADYMACLAETQKLEEVYLEKVINIPIVQEVSYTLFSDRLVLPVSTYIPGFGWGTIFGDIAE